VSDALHLTLHDKDQAGIAVSRALAPYCKQLWAQGKVVYVIAQPEEDARTLMQNKFYWGVLLRQIADQAVISGAKWSVDAWHELFKREFLPRLRKKVIVAGRKRPVWITTIGSTRELSVKKMTEYMERVMAYASTELGVVFTERALQGCQGERG
jgi:hypothetical protein